MTRYFEQTEAMFDCHTLAIPLVDLAKQRGIHPDKVLKGTKLFYHDMLKGRCRISHVQLMKLVVNIQKQLNQDDTPFLLGRRMFPANLGLLGNALLNSASIADMLQVANRFQLPLFAHCFVQSKFEDGIYYLTFNPAVSIEQNQQQIFLYELLACAIVSGLKWRLQGTPDISIRFPYEAPKYIEQYQVNLDCKMSFFPAANHFGLQISLSRELMFKPFADANSSLKQHYLRQIPNYHRRVGLLQYILQFMNAKKEVTLEQVSGYLQVSPATLKRKLANHNTSFQKLYDQHRQQQAIFALGTIGETNEVVSKALNFSDITNFRRSFKRWTGMTPNALKQLFL